MTHRILTRIVATSVAMGTLVLAGPAAATVYLAGTADNCPTCTFGNHLVPGDAHPSVPGGGPASGISNAGDTLNGSRTYIYDQSPGDDLTAQVANRADVNDFAMLIWDMGAGNAFDTMRLYTHQDHYSGGAVTTNFVAQDLMEYSVWGSNDGDAFVLLSDVVGFDINGGGAGLPTYTFVGTEPTVVYRGGSDMNGILNAYTRDYTFDDEYRYFGVRTSSISLMYPLESGGFATDADPEIDAIAGNDGPIGVPEPGALVLLGIGLLLFFAVETLRQRRRSMVPARS